VRIVAKSMTTVYVSPSGRRAPHQCLDGGDAVPGRAVVAHTSWF